MKIAIISTMNGSPWGGSEELWSAMAGEALQDGLDVFISLYKWASIPSKVVELQKQGAIVHFRPNIWNPQSTIERITKKVTYRLLLPLKHISALHPDIICISQGGTYDGLYLPDLINLLISSHIPYVVISHSNSDFLLPAGFSREAAISYFNEARSFISTSNQLIKTTERQLACSLNNAIVINNPVNLKDIQPVPWQPDHSLHMASVGHLRTLWKGQDILFEVLSSPEWRIRNWQLNLYGDGPDKSYLKELANYYGIAEKVMFWGYVNDIAGIWAKNHILLMPSRVESQPIALLEAMLCARPTVATDVGDIVEWIEDDITGFVAQAPTANSFGVALERAWSTREKWHEMGVQAYQFAVSRYDPSPGRTLLNELLNAVHLDKN